MQPSSIILLDYDNCLGDIEAGFALSFTILEAIGVAERSQLHAMRSEAEASGGSYDVLSDIRRRGLADNDQINEFRRRYENFAEPETLLMPGAAELLDDLRNWHQPHAVMTKGGHALQSTKLNGAGLKESLINRYITDQLRKGEIIATWWSSGDGVFVLPPELGGQKVHELLLIDDKAVSFTGLPAAAQGIQTFDPANYREVQKGEAPSQVTVLTDLHAVRRELADRRARDTIYGDI